MKDKLISYKTCESIFDASGSVSFGTSSPIPVINGPEIPMLYAWSGTPVYTSLTSLSLGTISRWRPDKDALPLNHDQWTIWTTGTADIVRVQDVSKHLIVDHWCDNIPSELAKNAPIWVNDQIIEMLSHF